MCGCLLLPIKLVFVALKLALLVVVFMLSLLLLPLLLLAGLVFLLKSLF